MNGARLVAALLVAAFVLAHLVTAEVLLRRRKPAHRPGGVG